MTPDRIRKLNCAASWLILAVLIGIGANARLIEEDLHLIASELPSVHP